MDIPRPNRSKRSRALIIPIVLGLVVLAGILSTIVYIICHFLAKVW